MERNRYRFPGSGRQLLRAPSERPLNANRSCSSRSRSRKDSCNMIDVKLFTAAAMAVCGLLATTDARAGETAGTMQSTPTPSITGPEVIRQLQDAWGRHRIPLVGETDGTMETPARVSALVDSSATRAPVVVGLEIPIEECAAIGAYLASEGSGHDRRKVTAGRFWQRTHQDGRSSAAVSA